MNVPMISQWMGEVVSLMNKVKSSSRSKQDVQLLTIRLAAFYGELSAYFEALHDKSTKIFCEPWLNELVSKDYVLQVNNVCRALNRVSERICEFKSYIVFHRDSLCHPILNGYHLKKVTSRNSGDIMVKREDMLRIASEFQNLEQTVIEIVSRSFEEIVFLKSEVDAWHNLELPGIT